MSAIRNRAKERILTLVLFLGNYLGVNGLFRLLNRHKTRVLMYHGVTSSNAPNLCWTLIPKHEFVWQMDYLKKNYNVERASVLLEGRKAEAHHQVVITFDDGLRNTHTEAWPVLKDRNLKAVCFVVPELSEKGKLIWADELYQILIQADSVEIDLSRCGLNTMVLERDPPLRVKQIYDLHHALTELSPQKRQETLEGLRHQLVPDGPVSHGPFALMTIEQIRELALGSEFEIGLHSNTHPILSTLDRAAQQREIEGCMRRLDDWGIPYILLFAYPNGRRQDFNETTMTLLRELGVNHAVSAMDGMHNGTQSKLMIQRVGIGLGTSRYEFKARLSGFFLFLQTLAGKR